MAKVKQSDLDAWGDHVEEYSKRQKQLHQDLINKHLMEQELKNTMTEKMNNNIQTNPDVRWTERKTNNTTTTWTENKRWLATVIGLLCVMGFMYVLFIYNLFLHAMAGVLGVWLLGMLLLAFKDIVDDLIDGW
jgi:Fe2+ transport system protein B